LSILRTSQQKYTFALNEYDEYRQAHVQFAFQNFSDKKSLFSDSTSNEISRNGIELWDRQINELNELIYLANEEESNKFLRTLSQLACNVHKFLVAIVHSKILFDRTFNSSSMKRIKYQMQMCAFVR
jgi:hypothetical protein